MAWVLLIPGMIIIGLIVGALGRLIVSGRNPMSLLAAIGLGIAGAVIGYLIGANLIIVFLLEIAAAACWSGLAAGGPGRCRSKRFARSSDIRQGGWRRHTADILAGPHLLVAQAVQAAC